MSDWSGSSTSRLQRLHLCLFLILSISGYCWVQGGVDVSVSNSNQRTVSSFSYSKTTLQPYDWSYIRVDLPTWFSSVSVSLLSDVDDKEFQNMGLPMICIRDGSLPLPDASESALKASNSFNNRSLSQIQRLQNSEQCSPLERNMTLKMTNEQISPGVWYLGLFNGIGSKRTQSKMINRGSSFTYSAVITIEECMDSTVWGPNCNKTVNPLSCASQSSNSAYTNKQMNNTVVCSYTLVSSCHEVNEPKVYYFDNSDVSEQLIIVAKNFSVMSSNKTWDGNLTCYAQHEAIPHPAAYDYYGVISITPLLIRAPMIGRWFITVIPVNPSDALNQSLEVCYSLEGQVLQCPQGTAGLNCSINRYTLETFIRKNPSGLFESYYLPLDGEVASYGTDFSLESLSKTSSSNAIDRSWTYFQMEIPEGAAGKNMQVKLKSDKTINYEIYSRYGGLPTLHSWDYFYANSTSNSNDAPLFKLYNSSKQLVRFYILYVREGTWTFGLRNLSQDNIPSQSDTRMSISLDRCPFGCSNHGQCSSGLDSSGLTLYSYCACGRDHGGFDCGVELVTRKGRFWQSFLLIASNAAALLPAFWAFYEKSLAEWFLFMSSGISSALYHACDVEHCVLDYHVLQFMDFWLSFVAVVSTFVYLTTISELSKRAILTAAWILTALMASTGATRSSNLTLIMVIGCMGLVAGWAIEFTTKFRTRNFTSGFTLTTIYNWQSVKGLLWNLVKTLLKRYRWGCMIAGFIAFALALTSWELESSETYWIWHSMWHLSIYTSSFFFLCSKVNKDNTRPREPPVGSYELHPQNSPRLVPA